MDLLIDFINYIIGLVLLIIVVSAMLFVAWTTLLLTYKLTIYFWSLFNISLNF